MASSVIASAGTIADPSGACQSTHLHYLANSGKWVALLYKSTSSTTLYARYSSDLSTWNDPTNPTVTLARDNGAEGWRLGSATKSIAGADVLHIGYISNNIGGTAYNQHLRAKFAGTTVTWESEIEVDEAGVPPLQTPSTSDAVGIASNGTVFQQVVTWDPNDISPLRADNADTTSSWTNAWDNGLEDTLLSCTRQTLSSCFLPLSSGGKVVMLADNGSSTTPDNIVGSLWGGSSWAPNPATAVFASTVSIDRNDWGACLLSDTKVHVVRRNDATSTFTHRIGTISGTTLTWAAGDTIANHTCKGGAGVAMASDGTSVWAFIIDSAGGNAIYYNKWTAGSWAGWTAFESSSATRGFVTAVFGNNSIAVAWSQTNGSNFDFMVGGLSFATTSTRSIPATAALKTTLTRSVAATAALKTTRTRSVAATAALKTTSARTIPATSALRTTPSRSVPSTAALRTTPTRTIPATAALRTTNTRTVPATAALLTTGTRTVPTTAALRTSPIRSIPSVAALSTTSTRSVPSTAALLTTQGRSVPATTALKTTLARTIPSTGTFKTTNARAIPATAALSVQGTSTRSIPATVALKSVLTRSIPATTALSTRQARSVPATAALTTTTTSTRAIPATAALRTTRVRAIPATAALAVTGGTGPSHATISLTPRNQAAITLARGNQAALQLQPGNQASITIVEAL